LKEFGERSRFQQTSPESHFTKGRICSLARPDGRITLSGDRLITTTGTKRTERILKTDAEIDLVLEKEFGVILFPTGETVH
jgi:N-hydroxyarylamine O-acetyltransferase